MLVRRKACEIDGTYASEGVSARHKEYVTYFLFIDLLLVDTLEKRTNDLQGFGPGRTSTFLDMSGSRIDGADVRGVLSKGWRCLGIPYSFV